jgi:regulator of ribosome biosynthesis
MSRTLCRPLCPILHASNVHLIYREEYEGSLEFDLGNLCAYDAQPVDEKAWSSYAKKKNASLEEYHRKIATQIFQSMTHKLFELPYEIVPVGRIAELPPPTTVLPREKPLPKPRAPTKWEVFAQRKGIQKRKRSNLEWDETTQEWRRRYGYKRVGDDGDIPIIDAGHDEDTGVVDPFTRQLKEKKERVKKQGDRQLANLKNAVKEGGKGALPATLRLAAALPEHGRGKPTKRKEMLSDLVKTSKHVAVSTASMGKHDKVVKGENMKHREGNKRVANKSHLSATVDRQTERESQGKLVDHIIRKNADDIIDIGKAIGTFESAAREQGSMHRMKKKGANKKGRLEGGSGQKKKAPPTAAGNKKRGSSSKKK